ncbi:hypothetical protein NLI96_g9571 [Meripilus lineatus]|uniref:Presequence translocated-associated motor subunit PAM17 n=1 Tax=Meripilus lineatus TaxID=2056292 RepID=A0AAD5UXF9_9APHY|nr:hypothetical protein NLI96_g9571 [Physisporinus lineatus]
MASLRFSNPSKIVYSLQASSRSHIRTVPRKSVFSRSQASFTGAGKPAPSRAEQESLPWAEYLKIRRNKRRWETAVTIPLTFIGFAGGVMFFGSLEMDPTKPIFNVDPMVVYGVATLGCAGFGYLLGPIIGSTCWRITHRNTMKLIEARDRQFHQHIVKNRVDPTAQSATNPVPDYYDRYEVVMKILNTTILPCLNQWLRDQAKFRKKAAFPLD